MPSLNSDPTTTLAPVRMAGGWHIETHVGGRRVATLSEFPTEADARAWAYLLSAAPDLLAACKLVVECYKGTTAHEQAPAWTAVLAAIARAEGG